MASGNGGLGTRITYSHHLVDLVAAAEAASVRLGAADPDRRAVAVRAARRESALWSARLDGSPISDETAAQVDATGQASPVAELGAPATELGAPVPGSWARALKLDDMPTQEVAAIEYANLLRCYDEEPELAAQLLEQPFATLRHAHGFLCAGLVDPGDVGRLRRSDQAVHDGAQGQVIYNAPDPGRLPVLIAELERWFGRSSAVLPTVVLAGVLHERILEWQPFEAGNGRLARVAARLVLRARGLDPHGAAVPERPLAADPLGYYREVAATIRRRGALQPWLERYAEAVVAGLEAAVACVDPGAPRRPSPDALEALAAAPSGQGLTLTEFAAATGTNLEVARLRLRQLVVGGAITPEVGRHGLRYRRRGETAAGCPPGQGYP